jgi:hypothetical protein
MGVQAAILSTKAARESVVAYLTKARMGMLTLVVMNEDDRLSVAALQRQNNAMARWQTPGVVQILADCTTAVYSLFNTLPVALTPSCINTDTICNKFTVNQTALCSLM